MQDTVDVVEDVDLRHLEALLAVRDGIRETVRFRLLDGAAIGPVKHMRVRLAEHGKRLIGDGVMTLVGLLRIGRPVTEQGGLSAETDVVVSIEEGRPDLLLIVPVEGEALTVVNKFKVWKDIRDKRSSLRVDDDYIFKTLERALLVGHFGPAFFQRP